MKDKTNEKHKKILALQKEVLQHFDLIFKNLFDQVNHNNKNDDGQDKKHT